MRILLALIFLVGCKGAESKDSARKSPDRSSQIFLFGDNTISDLGLEGTLKSYRWDGSNGATAFTQCHFVSRETYQPGDKIIFMAGYFDGLWYGLDDPDNSVLNVCTTAFGNAKSQGAEIIIITPINAAPSVFSTMLNDIRLPTNTPGASLFYSNILKSISNDLSLEVIDLNAEFVTDDSYFDGLILNEDGLTEVVRILGQYL